MQPLYQERQLNWPVIILIPLILGFVAIMDWREPAEGVPAWFYPVMLVFMSAFASMKLVVTRDRIRIGLTWGFPRKTIAIGDIRTFEVYKKTGIQAFLGSKFQPSRGQFTMHGRSGLVIFPEKGQPITISSGNTRKFRQALEKAIERKNPNRGR